MISSALSFVQLISGWVSEFVCSRNSYEYVSAASNSTVSGTSNFISGLGLNQVHPEELIWASLSQQLKILIFWLTCLGVPQTGQNALCDANTLLLNLSASFCSRSSDPLSVSLSVETFDQKYPTFRCVGFCCDEESVASQPDSAPADFLWTCSTMQTSVAKKLSAHRWSLVIFANLSEDQNDLDTQWSGRND